MVGCIDSMNVGGFYSEVVYLSLIWVEVGSELDGS